MTNRAAKLSPMPETCLVTPALASVLSGLEPHLLRNLALGFDRNPEVEDGPVIRSTHIDGRFLVRLDDVMFIAQALAEGISL